MYMMNPNPPPPTPAPTPALPRGDPVTGYAGYRGLGPPPFCFTRKLLRGRGGGGVRRGCYPLVCHQTLLLLQSTWHYMSRGLIDQPKSVRHAVYSLIPFLNLPPPLFRQTAASLRQQCGKMFVPHKCDPVGKSHNGGPSRQCSWRHAAEIS